MKDIRKVMIDERTWKLLVTLDEARKLGATVETLVSLAEDILFKMDISIDEHERMLSHCYKFIYSGSLVEGVLNKEEIC